ncbi:phosphomevalonate kinase [Streptococcus sp. zg-JUN1979]|uniref:phosphomevalonate kinase n=1 Tax=Streptococcus sp. zg-JUN1979 TaxID=3391450 RepID=UPI0039A6C667
MVKVKAGGKLYLAGEYAILEEGQEALIHYIPICLTGRIDFAEDYALSSDMFAYSVGKKRDANYALIQDAVAVGEAYLAHLGYALKPFNLRISGKLEKDGKKFGIGSSGSVVVLTLKALAALYGLALSSDMLFKLATYVLLKRGDNGSMGDVACIAYETLISFRAFNRASVRDMMESCDMMTVLEAPWGYRIVPVTPRLSLDFVVGWTKTPSISKKMIKRVKSAINTSFLQASLEHVNALHAAIEAGDKTTVIASIEASSRLLDELSPAIYTEPLRALKEATNGLDSVAKSSGSGGGDCGIALSFTSKATDELIKRWQNLGIEVLYQERWGQD